MISKTELPVLQQTALDRRKQFIRSRVILVQPTDRCILIIENAGRDMFTFFMGDVVFDQLTTEQASILL